MRIQKKIIFLIESILKHQVYFVYSDQQIQTILYNFKIITSVIALILYSYYSYEDMGFMQVIKGILVVIFSEIYLIYGFIKLVLGRYKKGIDEI